MVQGHEYAAYDGLGLADLVRRREVTPHELYGAAMAMLEVANPKINAIAFTMEDVAQQALIKEIDGPFRGVPFVAKDLVASYAGVPTNSGSLFTNGLTRYHDSEIVSRFRRAGLVTIAKTTTPELGLCASTESRVHGPTRNPWNPGRIAGGSSGGSAAAVAAGIAPIGHANDGGGSTRIPASCCGLVGLKPSRGLVPLGPDHGNMWSGLVAEHVLTRTIRDTAAMLDCVAGPSLGDPYASPAVKDGFLAACSRPPPRLRIGLTTQTFAGEVISSAAREAALTVAQLLSDLGHQVIEATPSFDVIAYAKAHATILSANIAAFIEDAGLQLGRLPGPDNLEPMTLWLLEEGRGRSAIELVRAQDTLNLTSRRIARFFENIDVLLTPTLAMPPPEIGHLFGSGDGAELRRRTLEFAPFTHLFNGTGQPAISLPATRDSEGLPIGVQFVARFGEDACLLQLATEIEMARPWSTKPAMLKQGNDASRPTRREDANRRECLQ